MSGHDQYRRNLPAVRGQRNVGIRIGNQIYIPALPVSPGDAWEVARILGAHGVAVAAMDNLHASAAAFQAHRNVIDDEAANIEAQREAEHQQMLAEKRRDRELYEADLEIIQAKHKAQAAEAFRDDKFELGAVRFRERMAKHRVGEAAARAAMQEEILEPEPKPEKTKSLSTAEMLARLIDDLEKQIDEAEAAGRPTDGMRGELKTLNVTLRRELLKFAGR